MTPREQALQEALEGMLHNAERYGAWHESLLSPARLALALPATPAPDALRYADDPMLRRALNGCVPMLLLAAHEARKVKDFELAQRHSDTAEVARAALGGGQ